MPVSFGRVVTEPRCCRSRSVVHGRLARPPVSTLSLSRLTMAYHVAWHHAVVPARILVAILALRLSEYVPRIFYKRTLTVMLESGMSLRRCGYNMSDEETNICVVVALWRVLNATRGGALAPLRVVTVYIYVFIGARFTVWVLSCGMWQWDAAQTWPATGQGDNQRLSTVGRRDSGCGVRALTCLRILATLLSR